MKICFRFLFHVYRIENYIFLCFLINHSVIENQILVFLRVDNLTMLGLWDCLTYVINTNDDEEENKKKATW